MADLITYFYSERVRNQFELTSVVLSNGCNTLLVLEWWLLSCDNENSLPIDVFVVYMDSKGQIDNSLATLLQEEEYFVVGDE